MSRFGDLAPKSRWRTTGPIEPFGESGVLSA